MSAVLKYDVVIIKLKKVLLKLEGIILREISKKEKDKF